MVDRTTRLWVAGILTGLALMGAVAFLLLGPGRFNPSPPSLSGNPLEALPGRIAYVDDDECILIVDAATAAERELYCPLDHVQALTFVDAGTLAFLAWRGSPNPHWMALDIATGNTTDLGTYPDPGWNYDPTLAGRVFVAEDGEVFVEEDGMRRSIYDASFPEYRQPQPIALSPDGKWLMAFYSPPRGDSQQLWVIALDGSAARTVTRHANWDHRTATWWVDGHGTSPTLDHPPLPAAR